MMGLRFTCFSQFKTSSASTEKITAITNPPPGEESPSPGEAGDPAGRVSSTKAQVLGIYAPYCYLIQYHPNFVISVDAF